MGKSPWKWALVGLLLGVLFGRWTASPTPYTRWLEGRLAEKQAVIEELLDDLDVWKTTAHNAEATSKEAVKQRDALALERNDLDLRLRANTTAEKR